MEVEILGENMKGKIVPDEKYLVAKCNPDNISEDYVPNLQLRSFCGTKRFFPELLKKIFGALHYGFNFMYQSHQCYKENITEETCEFFNPFILESKSNFNNLPTIIAFLMGFYLNLVCSRWWDQICLLPDTDNVCLYLASYMNGTKPEAELELKKKLLRYMNLSWTLAMSRVSSCIYKRFPDEAAYIDTKLVTQEEANEMKISGPDNVRSGHWFMPLDKAVALIGKGHLEGLFPVYPEYLVKEVVQYRKDLQTLMDYNSNPLPIVFSQTVGVCLVFWAFLGVFMISEKKKVMVSPLEYFSNFPMFRLLISAMLLNWFIVCVKLHNPFGSDKGFDIALPSELDINLWKGSVMIWKQDMIRKEKKNEDIIENLFVNY